MLHKATSIKEISYLRVHFLRHIEKKSNSRCTIFCLERRFQLLYGMRRAHQHFTKSSELLNLSLLKRNMNLWGNSYNTVSFSQHRPLSLTPSFHKQARTSSSPLCESILTPNCQQEPIHIPLPSNSLFYSGLLSLALPFSAKSQIGGWGVFCGPNKRAKVVRTPLYESVGGEQ